MHKTKNLVNSQYSLQRCGAPVCLLWWWTVGTICRGVVSVCLILWWTVCTVCGGEEPLSVCSGAQWRTVGSVCRVVVLLSVSALKVDSVYCCKDLHYGSHHDAKVSDYLEDAGFETWCG